MDQCALLRAVVSENLSLSEKNKNVVSVKDWMRRLQKYSENTAVAGNVIDNFGNLPYDTFILQAGLISFVLHEASAESASVRVRGFHFKL